MPGPRVVWTEDRIREACAVLAACATTSEAATVLSERWGMLVTRPQLRDALAIRRLPTTPTQARGEPRPAPTSPIVTLPPVTMSRTPDFPVPVPVPSYPAWQDYSPRPDYEPPDDVPPAEARPGEVRRGIIIPDAHVPHHSLRSWACVLGILREWRPHFGVIIGDFLDLESLSFHPKNRPDLVRLAAEYYAGNIALDALQGASADTQWTYLEGNHEGRATRYQAAFGQLDGMLSVPLSLYIAPRPDQYHRGGDVKLRGMRWVPLSQQPYLMSHSAYAHGTAFENKYHAFSHASETVPAKTGGLPLFYGHMHVLQMASSRSGHLAQCVGFLGDERSTVFGYTKGRPNGWTQAVVLQEVDESGLMSWTPIVIRDGRAIVGGKVISGGLGE